MAKEQEKRPITEEVSLDADDFITDDNDETTFSDANIFIADAPRKWIANTKVDKDGLSVRQHLLIYHVTIKANWFSDVLYPTLKEKCIQYHQERNLASMGVTTDSFYKSYPSIEYSYLKVPKKKKKKTKKISKYIIEKKKPIYTLIKKKYIDLELIESVIPFILQWYPSAIFFVQTLNMAPYILDVKDYYWIYHEVKKDYPQKLKHFFEANCPHLNYNTFTSIDNRKCGVKIKKDLKKYIAPYISEYYPDAIKKKEKKEPQ